MLGLTFMTPIAAIFPNHQAPASSYQTNYLSAAQ